MEGMSNKSVEWKELLDVALDAKGSNPIVMDMAAQCSWGGLYDIGQCEQSNAYERYI